MCLSCANCVNAGILSVGCSQCVDNATFAHKIFRENCTPTLCGLNLELRYIYILVLLSLSLVQMLIHQAQDTINGDADTHQPRPHMGR